MAMLRLPAPPVTKIWPLIVQRIPELSKTDGRLFYLKRASDGIVSRALIIV